MSLKLMQVQFLQLVLRDETKRQYYDEYGTTLDDPEFEEFLNTFNFSHIFQSNYWENTLNNSGKKSKKMVK